ncbi:caldesmon, putative [Entamoeba invadens IP1]|uniref:Caldesmon, putative n=1 Tax=Entamoeba invadens IP1 TaxID=370355 RepID=A0A0A1TXM5_ENTIV|nr:caldesmon, putative [Entamoeba invadens IP1]ELP86109.1 caldesmon, putative [Entamoeba invadens IP1]|eukprot:XP_004185455.1 caldesmon, putative [Entamoeba invadens IP1]
MSIPRLRYDYFGGIIFENNVKKYFKVWHDELRVFDESGKTETLDGGKILKIGVIKNNAKKFVVLTDRGLREFECQNSKERESWLRTFETVRIVFQRNNPERLDELKKEKHLEQQKTNTENVIQSELNNKIKSTLFEETHELINLDENEVIANCENLLVDEKDEEIEKVIQLLNIEEQTKNIKEKNEIDVLTIVAERRKRREEEREKWKKLELVAKNDEKDKNEKVEKRCTNEIETNEKVEKVMQKVEELVEEIGVELTNEEREKIKGEEKSEKVNNEIKSTSQNIRRLEIENDGMNEHLKKEKDEKKQEEETHTILQKEEIPLQSIKEEKKEEKPNELFEITEEEPKQVLSDVMKEIPIEDVNITNKKEPEGASDGTRNENELKIEKEVNDEFKDNKKSEEGGVVEDENSENDEEITLGFSVEEESESTEFDTTTENKQNVKEKEQPKELKFEDFVCVNNCEKPIERSEETKDSSEDDEKYKGFDFDTMMAEMGIQPQSPQDDGTAQENASEESFEFEIESDDDDKENK